MYNKFVRTANVLKFLAGYTALQKRGAEESCIMLVAGQAGLGKTRTIRWWAAQPDVDAVYIRATSGITQHWILAEIVREMGETPHRYIEYCFAQALKLVALQRRPIIIDEGEHCLHDPKVLESVRDLSDLTEVPVILVGYQEIKSKLARYPQISSRISALVEFKPLEAPQVKTICTELCEIAITDDAHQRIYKETKGYTRGLKECISTIEAHAERNNLKTVTAADLTGVNLMSDWTSGGGK